MSAVKIRDAMREKFKRPFLKRDRFADRTYLSRDNGYCG